MDVNSLAQAAIAKIIIIIKRRRTRSITMSWAQLFYNYNRPKNK
jgi:hypothetical protein